MLGNVRPPRSHSTLPPCPPRDVRGQVLMNINARKVANKHIVIGCTVIPGYIEGVGKYLIQDCVNTSLSYHPEFIAQGDIMNGTLRPDMALIGEGSKAAGDVLEKMNMRMTQTKPIICRMSPASAEITKLSINCFVTMKVCFAAPPRLSLSCSHFLVPSQVSYANMIGDIADRTPGASKHDILNAVGSDSRVGKKCASLPPSWDCFNSWHIVVAGTCALAMVLAAPVSLATTEH